MKCDFTTVILKPSHRCNFNCSYCYDRFERSKNCSILPVEDCIECIRKLYNWFGPLNVVWHGGEPLLLGEKYLDTVMSSFINDKISWVIQTNGSLLTDKIVDILCKYNVDVGISWDGWTQEKDRSKIDILHISELFKKHGKQGCGILKTITPENSKNLISEYLYCEDNDISFAGNFIFGEKISKKEWAELLTNSLSFFKFICTNTSNSLPRPFEDFINHYTYHDTFLCERTWCIGKWFSIAPNGDLFQCGHAWDEKYKYGNLLDDSFNKHDIYISDGFKRVWSMKEFAVDHCKKCQYFNACRGNCFSSTVLETEVGYEFDEEVCSFSKALIAGCYDIIEETYEKRTMRNKKILNLLQESTNGELKKWKDYKYPSIMI